MPTVSFSGNIYTYGATAVLNTTGITTTGANAITAIYSGDSNYSSLTSTAVTVTVGHRYGDHDHGDVERQSDNPERPANLHRYRSGRSWPNRGNRYLLRWHHTAGNRRGRLAVTPLRSGRRSGAAFWGGAHNITATFGGNATFMASTSPVFVENVTQGTVTISLTAKTVGNSNQNYTFAAVLTPSQTNATYAPNQGLVNFYDGATLIGSGQPQTVTTTQGGYGLWTATTAYNSFTAGTHTITATYTDINYSLGTSNAQTVYVGNSATSLGIYSPVNGSTLTATLGHLPLVPGRRRTVLAGYWSDPRQQQLLSIGQPGYGSVEGRQHSAQ